MEIQLHRFYENELPNAGDCVTARVDRIDDNNIGVYVSLMEYGGIEAMVQLSELSRRRVRNIRHLIRIGKYEVFHVLRVDDDRGYVDLTKKCVTPDDMEEMKKKFSDGKLINTIMNQVAIKTGTNLTHLYETLVWSIYRENRNVFQTFRSALADPSVLDPFELSDDVVDILFKQIQKYMKPKVLKLNAHVQVQCFTPEGIDIIKEGFAAAIRNTDPPVRARLIAPPVYILSTETLDKELGVNVLSQSLHILEESIVNRGGKFEIKKAPGVMHQQDEEQLQMIMERVAHQNQEIDGDELDDE